MTTSRAKSVEKTYRVKAPEKINVKAIRSRIDMTQEEFAGLFGFSINTLHHWGHGSRQPEGTMRAYLVVIQHVPMLVQKALLVN